VGNVIRLAVEPPARSSPIDQCIWGIKKISSCLRSWSSSMVTSDQFLNTMRNRRCASKITVHQLIKKNGQLVIKRLRKPGPNRCSGLQLSLKECCSRYPMGRQCKARPVRGLQSEKPKYILYKTSQLVPKASMAGVEQGRMGWGMLRPLR